MGLLLPIEVRPEDVPVIPGLSYFRDYIIQEDEINLAAAIDAEPWDTTWERRRQFYGGSYGPSQTAARSIPDWGIALAERMRDEGLSPVPFDQMLVNEYLPGQGIAMHRDYDPYDRTVVSLSLLAPCVMEFHRPSDKRKEVLLLQRRSLLVLSDEARYLWEHGIARRKSDRWYGVAIPRERRLSVTFRLLKRQRSTEP